MQAAIGGWHCLAVTDDGQVYAWGGNEYSQCGLEEAARDILTPQLCMPHLRVKQARRVAPAPCFGRCISCAARYGAPSPSPQRTHALTTNAQVACGGMSSVLLTDDGDVWTWGEPWGDFSIDMSREPRKVRAFAPAHYCSCEWLRDPCAPRLLQPTEGRKKVSK